MERKPMRISLLKIKFVIPLLAVLLLPVSVHAEILAMHRPEDTYVNEDGKMFAYDSLLLKEEEARSVAKYIFDSYGPGKYPFIFSLPLHKEFYLVAAIGYQGDKDRGLRFFLIKNRNGRLSRQYTTKGAGDSYILNPTFFYDRENFLIFGEVGSQYSWGFSVFKFEPEKTRLLWLGMLHVAKPSEHFNETTSAIDIIQVVEKDGAYEVRISGDFVLDPGTEKEKLYRYKGESFIFLQKKNHFIFQPPADDDAAQKAVESGR